MLKAKLAGRFSVSELKRDIDKIISDIANQTKSIAEKQTPIDTGRARRGWSKREIVNGYAIENAVPYIGFLEKGRSKQAPRGILKPTVRKVTGNIKRKLTR